MVNADYKDKDLIVNILAKSFQDNKSVNYITKEDQKKGWRIKALMEYSFDLCYLFGNVFLTDDKKGCALVLLPDKKRTTLQSILLDIKLIVSCIDIFNIKKVMEREAAIKKLQSHGLKYYLWFIGVKPEEQNKGIGTILLKEIIKEAEERNRLVCLETSTEKNIPWYKKFGFEIYNELNLGYRLYFMKKG